MIMDNTIRPAKCTVYDMCNIKSSICTQYPITSRAIRILQASFLICIFGLLFNTISVFAGDEITGKIFDKRGKPSEGVQIYVFTSDLKVTTGKGNIFSKNAISSTSSSRDGSYTISIVSTENVSVIGKKKDLWFYRIVHSVPATVLNDTLKECGNLSFYLHIEKSKQKDLANVSLIGTPFSARSDKNGIVSFDCISPGAYQAIITTSLSGYKTVLCSLRIIESVIDTFTDTLTIPFTGINTISFSETSSDTLREIYIINTDKKKTDTIPVTQNNEIPFVNAGNDTTVGLRDMIMLHGTAGIKVGTITLWEWSIDNSSPHIDTSGKYSIVSPPKADKLTAILRVTADNNKQASDTLTIHVVSSPPQVYASGDTSMGIFDTIHLSGSANDNGKIVSMGWDIGNSGKFTLTKNGTALALPDGIPHDSMMCIFRAIDDDGETSFDTIFTNRKLFWERITPTPQIPDRKGHALVNFNSMLWIIGGNKSDIWNSPDGERWQQVTDSSPFGIRFGHSATAFNGQLFVIGGKGPDDSYNNDIWSSLDGKNWRKILEADFLKRHYHSVTQFKDRLWIIGGLGESGYEACLNDIWSSEDGNRWKPEGDTAQFSRRYGHGAVVLNNSLIISGGFYEGFSSASTLRDTWSSSDGIAWKKINDSLMVKDSVFHTYLEYGNRIWSIGGYCSSCSKSTLFTGIYSTVYGTSWVSHTSDRQTGSLSFCAGAVFNNRIFVSPSDTPFLLILR